MPFQILLAPAPMCQPIVLEDFLPRLRNFLNRDETDQI
jgi:hypothetical protein